MLKLLKLKNSAVLPWVGSLWWASWSLSWKPLQLIEDTWKGQKKQLQGTPIERVNFSKHSMIPSPSFLFSRTRYLSDWNPRIAHVFTTGFLFTSLPVKQLTQTFCHLLSLIMVLSRHLTFINNVRQKSIVFSSQIPHRFQWFPSPLLGRQMRDLGSGAFNILLLMGW